MLKRFLNTLPFGKFTLFLKFSLIIFLLLIIYTGIQGYRASMRTLAAINERFLSDDSLMVKMVQSEPLFNRIRKAGWLQARLDLSAMDSIILVVDLADSSVSMMLKGIMVYEQRIENFRISKIFDKMDRSARISLASTPLLITVDTANIPKTNYRTVTAPKNEEEANLLSGQILPDTINIEVSLSLWIENGIMILIQGVPGEIHGDSGSARKFMAAQDRKDWIALFEDLITLEIPEYHPWIRIYLPSEEVKNIYRSIPSNGMVMLNI